MKIGFYPALGTPLDDMGNIVASSMTKHVQEQVEAGASGVLVLGSMGIQAYIKQSETVNVARITVEAANHACPVFVGVMDNSIKRVIERINALKGLSIQGVVATTPYYNVLNQTEIVRFFEGIANHSPFPVYMYDLAVVTKSKIEVDTAIKLLQHKNIVGIKTGDLVMVRLLHQHLKQHHQVADVLYSGLDTFDIAAQSGFGTLLDGMFSCTASISSRFVKSLRVGEFDVASQHLNDILRLRNLFVQVGVFSGFSHAMNLLGYEGNFAPDYSKAINDVQKESIKNLMKEIKLI